MGEEHRVLPGGSGELREDFLIGLYGEDTSLVERAEERADRFVDYKDSFPISCERSPLAHSLALCGHPRESSFAAHRQHQWVHGRLPQAGTPKFQAGQGQTFGVEDNVFGCLLVMMGCFLW